MIFVLGLFLGIPFLAHAKEATLTDEYLNNVYSIHTLQDGTTEVYQEAIFRLDGKLAYCLNPSIVARPGNYLVTEGLSGSYLSDEQKEYVEAIGHYGYEYPGHQSTAFYLATQELIWEYLYNSEVVWNLAPDGSEMEHDVEYEKSEILSLVEKRNQIPSFHQNTITVYEGETLALKDENNVLNQFEISQEGIWIKGNILMSNRLTKDIKIKGTYQKYDNEVTLLYRQEGSQKLATLRLSKLPTFELDVKVIGNPLKIHKVGEVWNGIVNTGEWKNQNGVEFQIIAEEDIIGLLGQIIYQKGELIDTIVTKNGYATTKRLPNGKYKIVETKGKEGYSEIVPMEFIMNEEAEKEITIENYLCTGTLEVVKKAQDGTVLPGVTFGLYSKSGKKLDEQITDQNGKIVWILPPGDYQVKELKTLKGFVLDTTKKKVIVESGKTASIEQINVPMLPNTSGHKKSHWQFMIGIIGFVISKKLWFII